MSAICFCCKKNKNCHFKDKNQKSIYCSIFEMDFGQKGKETCSQCKIYDICASPNGLCNGFKAKTVFKEEDTFSFSKANCSNCLCRDKKRDICIVSSRSLLLSCPDKCKYFIKTKNYTKEEDKKEIIPQGLNRFELMDLDD